MTPKPVGALRCFLCRDKGFVKFKRGKKWDVAPCPKCNPDGMPGGPDGDDEY